MSKKINFFINAIFILFVLLLGIYCSRGVFTYYFFSTHDGDHHLARSYEAIEVLSEGHFPLRWGGKLNYFCGVPIFNFFYPLIYYLVFLFNLLVGDVILSIKIIYVLSFTIAPLFFYLWLKKETKSLRASFLGAILYLFVPYRFLLVFVRSSPEFLAYTILPIFLYFLSCFFEKIKNKGDKALFFAFGASLFGAALIVAHHLVAFLLFPVLFCWFLIKLFLINGWRKKKPLFFIAFLVFSVFGLSAFFWGPVFWEAKQVKLGQITLISYWHHFPTLKQLIRSPWDYFYSASGTEHDGMSFMLGYAQWLVLALTAISLLFWAIKGNFRQTRNKKVLFWFLTSCFFIFLMLEQSTVVWEKFSLLQKVQFPWRILGVTSFTIASLGGFWLSQIKNKKFSTIFFILIFCLAVYGNRNHLLSRPLANPEKYANFEVNHEHRYSSTTFGDDILNKEAKETCSFREPFLLVNDKPVNSQINRGNTLGEVSFYWAQEKKPENIKMNLEYFPGAYYFLINGKAPGSVDNVSGRIGLKGVFLNQGENTISWKIVQTPTQKVFNTISLVTLFLWIVVFIVRGFSYVGKKR